MSLDIGMAGTLSGTLSNVITKGRHNPSNFSIKRGIVVVAGTGNNNTIEGVFPANQSKTIGVGWTNPDEYRASPNAPGTSGGAWGLKSTGSNYNGLVYFYNYEVVAPGNIIRTTNLTYGSGNGYQVLNGASLATPLVSAIAAMILQKRPDLTYQQVKDVIIQGAEKVHSTTNGGIYNYINGYNNEMFWGRVSCINSLNIAETLGIENVNNSFLTIVKNMGDANYIIKTPENYESKFIELYDLSGKKLQNNTFEEGLHTYEINLNKYMAGMYIVKIRTVNGSNFLVKLVK